MKTQYSLLLPALIVLAFSLNLPASLAQLPPTNMGKFVHQPGDNQYSQTTQGERHGGNYFDTNGGAHVMRGPSPGMSAPSVLTVSPPPPKGPDVSIEPITADEPIPPPGFPPMPVAFDLPGTTGPSSISSSWRGTAAGGAAPAQGSGGGAPGATGMHQHYSHYQPGAFQSGGGGGAPAQDVSPAVPVGSSGSGSNYYKVRTPPPVMRSTDSYSVNTDPTGKQGAQGYSGVSGKDIKALGKAPELEGSSSGAPEAPTPVLVNQSGSQDLSLPDDEFTSRYFKNGKGGRYAKQMAKRTRSFGRQMIRSTGVPFSF